MRTHFFISLRYLLTKRKEKFISLISVISVLGISIGVMALIVVIAVMAGFDRDLKDKIVGNYSHITIGSYNGIEAGSYEDLAKKISANPHVRAVSPYIQGQILLKQRDRYIAVGIKGIKPDIEGQTTRIKQYIIHGDINNLGNDGIIIGKEMAYFLGLKTGMTITAFSPQGKQYVLRVAGIFYSGMYDYDMNLVFTRLDTAGEILGLGSRITALAVKLDNLDLADKVKEELAQILSSDYFLKTWMEANQNFFAALKLEKLTMFIILTLIILVASFNIISMLIVTVVEKTKDIGILKAIGMTSAGVRKIFIYLGLMIGILGTFFGALGGIGLCEMLRRYQFIKLPQDIYYIDRLPVALNWGDMFFVVLAAMVITVVSTIYPAGKAAGLKPVEALRYE